LPVDISSLIIRSETKRNNVLDPVVLDNVKQQFPVRMSRSVGLLDRFLRV
jgi:hypothetical protein